MCNQRRHHHPQSFYHCLSILAEIIVILIAIINILIGTIIIITINIQDEILIKIFDFPLWLLPASLHP